MHENTIQQVIQLNASSETVMLQLALTQAAWYSGLSSNAHTKSGLKKLDLKRTTVIFLVPAFQTDLYFSANGKMHENTTKKIT